MPTEKMIKLKSHPTGTEEAPKAISYTYLLEEADYLDEAYSKFRDKRESVLDDLLGTSPSVHMREEDEIHTGDELIDYIDYLQDTGYLEVIDDREEWER